MSKFILSLRAKILIMSLSMMTTIAVVGIYQMHVATEEESKDALLQFEGVANQLGDAIAAQFYERYGDVQAFALNTVIQSNDQAAITGIFNEYATLYGIYDIILFVDTKGHYIASNTKLPSGKPFDLTKLKISDYSGTAWFQHAMNGTFTEDKEKNFLGTFVENAQIDPIVSDAVGSSSYGNSFTTVVKDKSGVVTGVLTNRANFSWVENELKNSYAALKERGYLTAELTLLDKSGFVIAELDPSSNNGDSNVKRNFEILSKVNLTEKDPFAAKELSSAKSGYFFEMNKIKKIIQAVGFHIIDGQKWIESIGWSVLARESPDILLSNVKTMQRNFLISVAIFWLFFLLIGTYITQRLSNVFIAVSDKLRDVSLATATTSEELAIAAHTVAETTTEQAAAVQETVSSMAEISSMIGQTGQNVKECTDISQRVGSRTEEGGRIMQKMVNSMDAIQQANSQLQNMANIINEVSAKTMVINDIVFKTQLLSINASIEAARAGQHGKGFSVVAEEVGNLAQMSGNAAKEIQALIQDSQKQVGHIIESTQTRVRDGQSVSNEALATFTEIATGIQGINERIQGISQATKEQEAGIQQISIAMNQMDVTTQRNSSASTKTSELASKLSEHGRRVGRVMIAIRTLVLGNLKTNVVTGLKPDIVDKLIGSQKVQLSSNTTHQDHEPSQQDAKSSDDNSLSLSIDRLGQRRNAGGAEFQEPRSSTSIPLGLSADDKSFDQS